jgi:hypothetical protein
LHGTTRNRIQSPSGPDWLGVDDPEEEEDKEREGDSASGMTRDNTKRPTKTYFHKVSEKFGERPLDILLQPFFNDIAERDMAIFLG